MGFNSGFKGLISEEYTSQDHAYSGCIIQVLETDGNALMVTTQGFICYVVSRNIFKS